MPCMVVTTPSQPAGAELRNARQRAGLTRAKLAVLAGCSYAWIAQLEAGVQPVNSTKLEGIWRVLDALGGRPSGDEPSPRCQDGN
jgi:transcriptional regulator with XRE-family HTH domain